MDAERMMALLAEACTLLSEAEEHAAAAHIGHAMDLVAERHRVALPPGGPPCGEPD